MSLNQTVERTVTGLSYELVDIERAAGGLLRVTIDRIPGTVYPTGGQEFVIVEDCEVVTRQLQYVLEVEGADYARLEVSSPGLDRPLKTPEHYARFVGELVQITLKLPFQGRKKYQGRLQAAESGEGWTIQFNDGKADQVLNFAFDEVREARLVPVLDFKGRRGKGAPAAEEAAADNQDDGGQEE
ncbi:MAG: ribosome maturation factor RimP [Ideonella sp. MAG2]|nr:MAG: ribosome maturation factor RimP [Ideonella sp. MAG2]